MLKTSKMLRYSHLFNQQNEPAHALESTNLNAEKKDQADIQEISLGIVMNKEVKPEFHSEEIFGSAHQMQKLLAFKVDHGFIKLRRPINQNVSLDLI